MYLVGFIIRILFTLFTFHYLLILSFLSIRILLSLFPYLLIPLFLLAVLSVARYVRTVYSQRYVLPTCKLLPYRFHVSTRNTISNQRLTFMQPNVACCLVVVQAQSRRHCCPRNQVQDYPTVRYVSCAPEHYC